MSKHFEKLPSRRWSPMREHTVPLDLSGLWLVQRHPFPLKIDGWWLEKQTHPWTSSIRYTKSIQLELPKTSRFASPLNWQTSRH